jgi:signal transduction histidine kinase
MRAVGMAEERARLAREMHDSLIKSLYGMAITADTLPRWIERSPDRAVQQAVAMAAQLHRAARESREMVKVMRSASATQTLAGMIGRSVHQWRRDTGRQATAEIIGAPALPAESAYELVAILSEALENIKRHTPPTASARVSLRESDSWVELTVTDNGREAGGPESPVGPFSRAGHFGLVGMRERASRVGGDVQVESTPGVGVSVRVRLPAPLRDTQHTDQTDDQAGLALAATTSGGLSQ